MQELIFSIAILIFSVVIHEVSHGYVADILGDPTARLQGRLTLNPIPHLDVFGSIILPTLSFMFGGFIIGWAKPVPYNPYNLGGGKWGPAIVAAAGPASNILIAVIFSIFIRFGLFSGGALFIVQFIVLINLILAFFNLIPIPPLDGSKIVASLIPYNLYPRWQHFEAQMSRYGLLIILFFFLFLWPYLGGFVFYLSKLLTGLPIL